MLILSSWYLVFLYYILRFHAQARAFCILVGFKRTCSWLNITSNLALHAVARLRRSLHTTRPSCGSLLLHFLRWSCRALCGCIPWYALQTDGWLYIKYKIIMVYLNKPTWAICLSCPILHEWFRFETHNQLTALVYKYVALANSSIVTSSIV